MQQQILLLDGRNPLSPVPSPLHATSINSVATNNANTVRPSLGIPTGPAAQMPPNGTGPVNGPATTHSHPPHTPAAVGHGHSHSHGPGHGHGHGHSHGHGHTRNIPGIQFDGMNLARSPPNAHTKSPGTKHVPCKFFRQGACQAGPACPFSHSTDAAADSAPCKYFTKGNCKFGAKCALAHILPDGRRVNRPNINMPMSHTSSYVLGGRVNPPPYHAQDSALANSLLTQQRMNVNGHRYPPGYGYTPASGPPVVGGVGHDDLMLSHTQQHGPAPPISNYDGLGIPVVGSDVGEPGSQFGSPVDEPRLMSPIGRTALEATLPASFDSQGVSTNARLGPFAASLPTNVGLGMSSPPPQRFGGGSDILKNLHDTAFGLDSLISSSNLGSSPPTDGVPRFLHSSARLQRPKMMSASLPRPSALDDLEDHFPMEEDFLPTSLHDDVLTPQERRRRLSRTEQDKDFSLGIFSNSTTAPKVGSPLASSPSRFGALFAKQRAAKKEEEFGHIGSPLRDSPIGFRSSPLAVAAQRAPGSGSGDGPSSPFLASPSMYSLSQQFSAASLHPATTARSRLDRSVSSPVSTRIDEELEESSDLVFSMEEEEKEKDKKNTNADWRKPSNFDFPSLSEVKNEDL